MTRIEFWCSSIPQPQGSSRAMVIGGRARVFSDNPKLKGFRKEVAQAAAIAIAEAQMAAPAFGKHTAVRLTVEFVVAPPKTLPKTRRYPVVRPDLDKLLRSIGDALTGVMYHDDSQVVTILAQKRYGDTPGVRVIAENE